MRYCKPDNKLAFRRLFRMELRRNAKSFVMLVVLGSLAPLAFVMLDRSPLFALAVVMMLPVTTGGAMSLRDKLVGDAQFFQGLPVSGYLYGASLLAVLAIQGAMALGFVLPYVWRPYLALGLGGAGLFAGAALALGWASWAATALLAAATLRFPMERAFGWALLGMLGFGAAFDRFAWPRLAPHFGLEQVHRAIAWVQTPVGTAAAVLLAVALGAAVIALSMRWLRTGIEGYRREDQAVI